MSRRAPHRRIRARNAQKEMSVQLGVSRAIGTTCTSVSAPELLREQIEGGEDAPVELGDLEQVFGHQPHSARDLGVEGEDHDRPKCNGAQSWRPRRR